MNYYERYMNGEHERVWDELLELGPDVRERPYFPAASAVATETMRRVSRNLDEIVERLRSMGYSFDRFPDGSRRQFSGAPLVRPSKTQQEDYAELETQAGPFPLSLSAFWQETGAVDLVGRHATWPDGLDPLVVDPPEGALSFLCELDEGEVDDEDVCWFAALAPDDLHKDNVSGGDPYGIYLPNSSADFQLLNERHELMFVPYLRWAILRCGGFPGLDERARSFEPLRVLTANLEPF